MEDSKLTNPYNTQFFAEQTPDPETTPNPNPEPIPEPKPEPQLSAEEQLQQMRVEMAKIKKAQEKAASEAADYKKKYNATLDETERKKQEEAEKQAEREEEFERIKKENTVNKFAKNYLTLGYPEDLAEKAAIAQYENDTDALFKVQSDFQATFKKSLESKWLKNRPIPQGGVGEEKTTVTKEQFDKMGYIQRVEFAEKCPETYKEYTQN